MLIFLINLSGCYNLLRIHPYPAAIENEIWICDEIDCWFKGWDDEKRCRYGEITINGETIEIDVSVDQEFIVFDYIKHNDISIKQDMLIYGKVNYSKSDLYLFFHKFDFDSFTVKLDENYDHDRYLGILKDETLTSLTFRRKILEEVNELGSF